MNTAIEIILSNQTLVIIECAYSRVSTFIWTNVKRVHLTLPKVSQNVWPDNQFKIYFISTSITINSLLGTFDLHFEKHFSQLVTGLF